MLAQVTLARKLTVERRHVLRRSPGVRVELRRHPVALAPAERAEREGVVARHEHVLLDGPAGEAAKVVDNHRNSFLMDRSNRTREAGMCNRTNCFIGFEASQAISRNIPLSYSLYGYESVISPSWK